MYGEVPTLFPKEETELLGQEILFWGIHGLAREINDPEEFAKQLMSIYKIEKIKNNG